IRASAFAKHVSGHHDRGGQAAFELVGGRAVDDVAVAEAHTEHLLFVEPNRCLADGRRILRADALRGRRDQKDRSQAKGGTDPLHGRASPGTGRSPKRFENANTKPPAEVSIRKPRLKVRSMGTRRKPVYPRGGSLRSR